MKSSHKILLSLTLATWMSACSTSHSKKITPNKSGVNQNSVQSLTQTLQSDTWISSCELMDTGSRYTTVNFKKDPQIAVITQSFFDTSDCTGSSNQFQTATKTYQVEPGVNGDTTTAQVQFIDISSDTAANTTTATAGAAQKISQDLTSKAYTITYADNRITIVDDKDPTFFGSPKEYYSKSYIDKGVEEAAADGFAIH